MMNFNNIGLKLNHYCRLILGLLDRFVFEVSRTNSFKTWDYVIEKNSNLFIDFQEKSYIELFFITILNRNKIFIYLSRNKGIS